MKQRRRGFILIYVVAMVAALTIMLLQLQQRQSIPRQTERELGHALQKEEGGRLLEFVIAGTIEQKLGVDPRLTQFRRLLAEDPARLSELEDALLQLKAMLDQMGFNIDISRRGSGVGLASKHDGEGVLFAPRLESYSIKLGERTYAIRVLPGNALPNLNALSYDSLWRTLRLLNLQEEEARDLAANLVDWRDADNFRTDSRGAEQEYYYSLTPRYGPRNALIRHWQELAYVKNVTPDRLQLLRDNFMLGPPQQRGVLVETASPELLTAVSGLKRETIDSLLAAYGKLPKKNDKAASPPDVASLNLTDSELAAFDQTVAWKSEVDRVRIEITGPDAQLRADYDIKNQRIIARW